MPGCDAFPEVSGFGRWCRAEVSAERAYCFRNGAVSHHVLPLFRTAPAREMPLRGSCGEQTGSTQGTSLEQCMTFISNRSTGVPTANHLGSLERFHITIQRVGSHPTVQGHGQAEARFSGLF